jgi:hypothetical protein
MTDVQFYVAVGIPTFAVLIGILMNSINQTGINGRFNSMDARFNSVDSRFNSLDVKFDTLIGKVVDLDNRVTRIEAKLGIN